MTFFAPENATRNRQTQRVFAAFELMHTLIDFAAALSFLIGSLLFAARPATRIVRELILLARGDVGDLARAEER